MVLTARLATAYANCVKIPRRTAALAKPCRPTSASSPQATLASPAVLPASTATPTAAQALTPAQPVLRLVLFARTAAPISARPARLTSR